MIEFKADCGHTVRARDEDAGRSVRCSYCGDAAHVPEAMTVDGDLDALLSGLDPPGGVLSDPGSAPRRKRSRKGGKGGMGGMMPGRVGFDPFALITRLIYFTVGIVVLVVVTRMVILPVVSQLRGTAVVEKPTEPVREASTRGGLRPAPPSRTAGLKTLVGDAGLYVSCVPDSASVYIMAQNQDSPKEGRIEPNRACAMGQRGYAVPPLSDGEYIVDFVIAWNDPKFVNYPDYTEFRRTVEKASARDAEKLLADYFLPDEADRVFVHRTDEQIYWVRQFRGVRVNTREWQAVRALFLPRIPRADSSQFAVDLVTQAYVPSEPVYQFDVEHVRRELAYYQVPEIDQPYVLDALKRIGVMPYVGVGDTKPMFFKIDVSRGVFGARRLK